MGSNVNQMQKVFMINANILNFFYKTKFDSSRQNFTDVQEVTLKLQKAVKLKVIFLFSKNI